MSKSSRMRFLMVALFSGSVWAQGIQNHDMVILAGPAWNGSQTIGGTNVTLASSSGYNFQTDYGYQVARLSAVSLFLDLSFHFTFPGTPAVPAPLADGAESAWDAGTLGLRLLVPVNSRLSFYTLSGGGLGSFSYPVLTGGASPAVSLNNTVHGVFVFGGGADVRLSRHWSLRMDVRDLVTGRDLNGPGRHHVLPSFGVAIHF